MACIFCEIASGGINAHVIEESDLAIAFLDAFPLARGHSLVVPRAHRERMEEMGEAECAATFELARRVAARIRRLHGDALVAVHNGKLAGQEVGHVHVHIIPRSARDGAGPVHSMFGAAGAKADDADLASELDAIRNA